MELILESKYKRDYRYYKILGLEKNADIENINKAYRLISRKYHPDINKDPNVIAIAKKINEAYEILSNPSNRLQYDNGEAECPKCWTHEVRHSQGKNGISDAWKCAHCGCNFTFVIEKIKKESETINEQQEYTCPRCHKLLIRDMDSGLYKCKNRTCKGVFSNYELKNYYSNSFRSKSNNTTSENQSKSQIKNKQQPRSKEETQFVFSRNERLILISIFGAALIVTFIIFCYLLIDFSLLILGLFIFLFGLTILSWYIYKYPKIISIIKSLIIPK